MQAEIAGNALGTIPALEPRPALEDYLPLVRFLAESIQGAPRQDVDIDDLYAAGLAGLWEAHATFGRQRNLLFVNHAQLNIQTAIQDYVRGRHESASGTD